MASTVSGRDAGHLADFLNLVRQRKALITVIASLVLLTAIVVTAVLPRWYLGTSKIRVEKPDGQVALFQNQAPGYYDPYFISDQFEIIQSPKILYPVIENLGLNDRIGRRLNDGNPLPTHLTYRYLVRRMLNVEARRSTSIIEINVFSRDPALAAEIANEIARVYEEDRIALATSDQREGMEKLKEELAAQEEVVSRQRDIIEGLRRDLNISGVDLSARYSDMEVETLRQMQNSLITLRVEAIGRKTRWERFRNIPFGDRLALINTELIQDTNIQNLLQAYLVADQNLARLRGRLGEAHPDLISARANHQKIREQLDALLEGYERSLEISYMEAQARVTELERQLEEARVEQILSARDKMRPFEEAVRKLEDETRLLTTLRLTLRQRDIDFQVPKKTIEILSYAEIARFPSKPSWPLNIFLAVVLGGLLGLVSALLVEYFDTSFRNVADIENRLGLPVLGVVPRLATPDRVNLQDFSEGEPFRVLHTNLNLALPAGHGRVLACLSAGPGEGKSTTVRHLAEAMAAGGERVLLVDADLRKPTQHRAWRISRKPGLSEVMEDRASFDEAVRREVRPRLDLLTSGGAGIGALSLLYAGRLRELLDQWKGSYDRVLLDAPPAVGVSDAAVIASLCEGVVLVIQHRLNPQSMVMRARKILDGSRAPIVGVVLNRVGGSDGEDYNYYTDNYRYYHDSDTPGGEDTDGFPEEPGASREKEAERIVLGEKA